MKKESKNKGTPLLDLQGLRQREFDRTGREPSPDWVGIDYEAEVCAALAEEIAENGI